MSSLENVPLGPCVHPVAVVISWMGPRLVDSHHLRMVSSEHSTGSLMSLSLLGSRCLKMVVLSWRSQALITARMMVCQKMYMYQRWSGPAKDDTSYSLVSAPAWLFPHNESHDQGASLPMGHRLGSYPIDTAYIKVLVHVATGMFICLFFTQISVTVL
ncbi:hypothetical protein F7725_004690 [Dissostichus mawsoni]|uniref:Uncharacterized protein n=1 Tax=Dissostichus mawsoni TaxID=36200 RepID=A0A7J5XJH2_DISMA|nr:hypothetical protein F7725_004690 [Dissostichus mawsoni]